jgi:hypothetical protein
MLYGRGHEVVLSAPQVAPRLADLPSRLQFGIEIANDRSCEAMFVGLVV